MLGINQSDYLMSGARLFMHGFSSSKYFKTSFYLCIIFKTRKSIVVIHKCLHNDNYFQKISSRICLNQSWDNLVFKGEGIKVSCLSNVHIVFMQIAKIMKMTELVMGINIYTQRIPIIKLRNLFIRFIPFYSFKSCL